VVARELPTGFEGDACQLVGFFSSARLVFTDFHMAKLFSLASVSEMLPPTYNMAKKR
jgi:hypothetical protein